MARYGDQRQGRVNQKNEYSTLETRRGNGKIEGMNIHFPFGYAMTFNMPILCNAIWI